MCTLLLGMRGNVLWLPVTVAASKTWDPEARGHFTNVLRGAIRFPRRAVFFSPSRPAIP